MQKHAIPLVSICFLLSNSLVIAASQHQLSVSTGVEYDSNPLLSSNDAVSVWHARVAPAYNLLSQKGKDEIAFGALKT